MAVPLCSKCSSSFAYEDNRLYICSECVHKWAAQTEAASEAGGLKVPGTYGTELKNGDIVSLINNLKIKGSFPCRQNSQYSAGGRRFIILAAYLPGNGAMELKSEFVKKIGG